MPIHDWSRGDDSLFHSFHLGWVARLCERLNKGILPSSCYAMSETFDHRSMPVFLDMAEPEHRFKDPGLPGDIRHLKDQPPRAHWVFSSNQVEYASRAVTIRACDTHHVEAAILIVCQQDKRTRARLEKFAERAVAALSHGIHLLIVDLFPPSRRDPQGIHKAIWDRVRETPFMLPPDKPLTVVSYAVGRETSAYVQPVAVGDPLPEMPIFLREDRYVPCPLEVTYRLEWQHFPEPLKGDIESPPMS